MNYADNHCKMSRDLAATKCPLFIEDRIIELEETPQTVRSQGAFTQVFSVDSASELPQCQYVRPRLPQWPAVGDTMATAIQSALVGQATPKAALQEAQKKIDRILKG